MSAVKERAKRYQFRRTTRQARKATNHWERILRWEESKRNQRVRRLSRSNDDRRSECGASVHRKPGRPRVRRLSKTNEDSQVEPGVRRKPGRPRLYDKSPLKSVTKGRIGKTAGCKSSRGWPLFWKKKESNVSEQETPLDLSKEQELYSSDRNGRGVMKIIGGGHSNTNMVQGEEEELEGYILDLSVIPPPSSASRCMPFISREVNDNRETDVTDSDSRASPSMLASPGSSSPGSVTQYMPNGSKVSGNDSCVGTDVINGKSHDNVEEGVNGSDNLAKKHRGSGSNGSDPFVGQIRQPFAVRGCSVVLTRIDETDERAYGRAVRRLRKLQTKKSWSPLAEGGATEGQSASTSPTFPSGTEDESPAIMDLNYRRYAAAASVSFKPSQLEPVLVDLSVDDDNVSDTANDLLDRGSDGTSEPERFQDGSNQDSVMINVQGQDNGEVQDIEQDNNDAQVFGQDFDGFQDNVLDGNPVSPASVFSNWFSSQNGGLEDYSRPPEIADYTSDEN